MKYRLKKITDYSMFYCELTTVYYPQVRKFGLWFYFNDPQNPRDKKCFRQEADAWKFIEKRSGKYQKVEYIYER
jgi:hypothetical protein